MNDIVDVQYGILGYSMFRVNLFARCPQYFQVICHGDLVGGLDLQEVASNDHDRHVPEEVFLLPIVKRVKLVEFSLPFMLLKRNMF